MKSREMLENVVVHVSVVGTSQTLGALGAADVAAYLRAITDRNESPMWAARKLTSPCKPGVEVAVGWLWADGHTCGAILRKEGEGVIVLTGGGWEFDPLNGTTTGDAAGEYALSVTGVFKGTVQYGPWNVMRWIGHCVRARDGETVGDAYAVLPGGVEGHTPIVGPNGTDLYDTLRATAAGGGNGD